MLALTQKVIIILGTCLSGYWISPDASRNSTSVTTLTLAFQNVWSSRKEFLVAPKLTLLSNVSSQIVLKMGYFLSFFSNCIIKLFVYKKGHYIELEIATIFQAAEYFSNSSRYFPCLTTVCASYSPFWYFEWDLENKTTKYQRKMCFNCKKTCTIIHATDGSA